MSKGSQPRPYSIPADEFAARYEGIFGKKKTKDAPPEAAPAKDDANARDAARYRFIEEHATMYGGGNGFTITCFVGVD